MGNGDFCYKFADLAVRSPLPVLFMSSKILNKTHETFNNQSFPHKWELYCRGLYRNNPSASFYQRQHVPFYTTSTATVEDVMPVDTSFFGTDRYTAEVCEKNLREAIDLASGKADACRRIMMADACGYIHIRQFSDARKAELINPFASPKYTFTDDDFCKARCRNPRA